MYTHSLQTCTPPVATVGSTVCNKSELLVQICLPLTGSRLDLHTPILSLSTHTQKEWSEYYYRDSGISLSELKQLEQEALQFCDGVIFAIN